MNNDNIIREVSLSFWIIGIRSLSSNWKDGFELIADNLEDISDKIVDKESENNKIVIKYLKLLGDQAVESQKNLMLKYILRKLKYLIESIRTRGLKEVLEYIYNGIEWIGVRSVELNYGYGAFIVGEVLKEFLVEINIFVDSNIWDEIYPMISCCEKIGLEARKKNLVYEFENGKFINISNQYIDILKNISIPRENTEISETIHFSICDAIGTIEGKPLFDESDLL
jgi:hypothetical protein